MAFAIDQPEQHACWILPFPVDRRVDEMSAEVLVQAPVEVVEVDHGRLHYSLELAVAACQLHWKDHWSSLLLLP